MKKKKTILGLTTAAVAVAGLGTALVACDTTATEFNVTTQNGDGALQVNFGSTTFVQNDNQSTTTTPDLTSHVIKDEDGTTATITLNENLQVIVKTDFDNATGRVMQILYRENADNEFSPCIQTHFETNKDENGQDAIDEIIEIQSGFTSSATSTGQKVTAGAYTLEITEDNENNNTVINISAEDFSAKVTSHTARAIIEYGSTEVFVNENGTKTNVKQNAFSEVDLSTTPISYTCSDGSVVKFDNGTISANTNNGSTSTLKDGVRTIKTTDGKTITVTPVTGTQTETGAIPITGMKITDGENSFSYENGKITHNFGKDNIEYSSSSGFSSQVYDQNYQPQANEDQNQTPETEKPADPTPDDGNDQTDDGTEKPADPTPNPDPTPGGEGGQGGNDVEIPPTEGDGQGDGETGVKPEPEPTPETEPEPTPEPEPEIQIADTIDKLEQAEKEQVISNFVENYKSNIAKTIGVPADDIKILGCDFDIQNVTSNEEVSAKSASDSVSVLLSYTKDGKTHYTAVDGSFQGDATTKTLFKGDKMTCSFEEKEDFYLTQNDGNENDLNKKLYSCLDKNFDSKNSSVIASYLEYGGKTVIGSEHKNSAELKMVIADKNGNIKTIQTTIAYGTGFDIQDLIDGTTKATVRSNTSEKLFEKTDNTIVNSAQTQTQAQTTEEGMGM